MGDHLKKVQPGDPLKIPAATFNAMIAPKSPTLHSYGDGAAIVKKPVAAYVEKVYDEGDLAGPGIGT